MEGVLLFFQNGLKIISQSTTAGMMYPTMTKPFTFIFLRWDVTSSGVAGGSAGYS
jgi:hypothetical protein